MRVSRYCSRLLRLLALTAFFLPLTSAFDRSPFTAPEYSLVLDGSPSMEERFPGFGAQTVSSWKEFAGGSRRVVIAGQHPVAYRNDLPVEARYTDLASALRAAAAAFSPASEKRILVVSAAR
jgi:hypothetical protein